MRTARWVVAALVMIGGPAAVAGDDPRFAASIEILDGGQPVRMALTGTAERTKWGLGVYALGSYVKEGVSLRGASDLIASDALKALHLVFERDVDGPTMAESFQEAIHMNHPAPEFARELAQLDAFLRPQSLRKGDHVWLISVPGSGLRVQLGRGPTVLIPKPAFARAAWEVYLGWYNLGSAIKTGLTARLRR
jgi:hypothetical protein